MRLFFLVILICTSANLQGEELSTCFYDHVKDAIELNRERRDLYSRDTNGESEKISRYLIFWEKLIILKSKKFDRRSKKFHRLNIPVMCEDFVDMNLTPDYANTTQIPKPYLKKFEPVSRVIKEKLKSKLRLGYIPFKKQLEIEIQALSFNPSYDCLLRHLFESLVRTADLAPRYLAKTPKSEQRSLRKLLDKYLRLQIFGIGQGVFIDKKARSLQAKGFPILCNDVPAVHLSPWE